MARPAIQTRIGRTIADLSFTVNARIARRTIACVRSLAGVETSAIVLARLVVGTKIKVLVAEQPTPTFIANALPRFLACSVYAARIRLALITTCTFPTWLTAARKKIQIIIKLDSSFCHNETTRLEKARTLIHWLESLLLQ